MTRKRIVLYLGLCLLILVGSYLLLFSGSQSQAEIQLEQIQIGMSRDDAIGILGSPFAPLSDSKVLYWRRNRGDAVVGLDENGRVRWKEWKAAPAETWWKRILLPS